MKLKRGDLIIIVILLLISFIPYLLIKGWMGSYDVVYAEISIGGKVYKEVPLTGQMRRIEVEVEVDNGTNKVVIEKEQIAMIEADCPDGICIETGWIGKAGESITCLPHRVHIKVKGQTSKAGEDAVDVRTH